MNVLIVGSGGREHALARKLAQSPRIGKLLIAPGNPGTALLGQNVPVGADDYALLVHMARAEQVDLAVIGPEAPLAAGLADSFAAAGIATFGPSAAAAQIESSKIFAKQIMRQAGVPTADAHAFDDTRAAIEFARSSGQPWVVKADGLAAGKGVVVAGSVEATVAAIELLGATSAGSRLLLEQPLAGDEVSVLALCDGERLLPLPPARDHKRLLEGDRGPNTGGMGAYAPSDIGAELFDQIVSDLMLPVVRELAAAGTPFRGALYAGVMLTPHGPRVLEFNARFGDPETQVILPLLDGDLLAALSACAAGRLDEAALSWRDGAAACVVLAAHGYPAAPRRGDPIAGLEALADLPDVLVFHAGTEWADGATVTAGGRVLCVTGLGPNRRAALDRAYAAVDELRFPGMQFRRDIGQV
ncbi:phosphoribosylamine--glycine ligase [Kouleothrix sp.]|uniref:phosphoribosylamine--glycine ligase n=1 Tax=Kouleothrix sp. TaxID=2779161 RepID=UPI00391C9674